MTTKIKPARYRVVSQNTVRRVAPGLPPAKFLRQSPPEHRNIPFAEDKDYIKADTFDKAVAGALGFGVGVWLLVTAYEWGWLQ